MMKSRYLMPLLAAVGVMVVAGCRSTHQFDPEKYEQAVKYLSPVDSVDQRHTWKLTTTRSYRVSATKGYNARQVRLFTQNPVTNVKAEVMAQASVSDGSTVSLTAAVPKYLTTLYAALIDQNGLYTVTEFNPEQRDVDFSSPVETRASLTYTPSQQTFTYLFEEDYPVPGDYDYNDLVLRISRERIDAKVMKLSVTIAAVGASIQLASGMRLVGFKYEDIDSVVTTTGETFSDGVPQGSLYMFDDTSLLKRGRNNEAVINLMVDAHWAMAFNAYVDYGLFQRKRYNVTTSTSDNFQLRSTRTVEYLVYFKSDLGLSGFTLEAIDPFIITQYYGGSWETHLDEFRDAQVLYEYPTPVIKDLPWALMVPYSDFAYPLEGNQIGFRKQGVMFGAYMTQGHSFGEWAENYQSNLDWFLYPTANQVY